MKRMVGSFLCLLCVSIHVFAQAKNKALTKTSSNLQVRTANGILEGVLENSGIRSFKGIPFAAPPVGDLRWREPQAVKSWTGVKKADHFGPRAMQTPIFGDMAFRSDQRWQALQVGSVLWAR